MKNQTAQRTQSNKLQNYEIINSDIREAFNSFKEKKPAAAKKRLKLSWSNWGFGTEPLEVSVRRLAKAGIEYIELHGNHYGPDLGYKTAEVLRITGDHGVKVAGVCGMFSADNDLSSNRPMCRQAAIDYIKRELEFSSAVGASYMLVVPGAVGRPEPYDAMEIERSAETLRSVADLFVKHKIRAAVEPIRSAEVSIVHTIEEAKKFISMVGHRGVAHINGDVYHMLVEESHIAAAIREAGEMLINLHMADTNRCALGVGSLDLDAIIMALYLIGYADGERYVTPEPLGPGGNPYPAMNGKPDARLLDAMVNQTAKYFREREDVLFL